MTLNESNDSAISEFEREYSDMIEAFKEHASGLFQKIRDAENLHHEKLTEECQNQDRIPSSHVLQHVRL